MLAALCSVLRPGVCAHRLALAQPSCGAQAAAEKLKTELPTKQFPLLISHPATPQPGAPVPCSVAQTRLLSTSRLARWRQEEEEEEDEELLWGQVRRSGGAVPSPVQ